MKKKLGMSASELERLCSWKGVRTFRAAPYWTAEIYSFGKYIREYGYYPSFLPLCIFTDHGPGAYIEVNKNELESTAPIQLYHSPRSVKRWKMLSRKPCFQMMSPMVFYRRSRAISQNPKAKGTLVFPAHATPSIEDVSDVDEFARQLNRLPRRYQPISVCLHQNEVNKGLFATFIKHGIPVFTAGNTVDYRFAERFYKILRNFKFASSNVFGSYAFYAIEMGIPFFIYGPRERYVNVSDPNIPIGSYNQYESSENYRKFFKLFKRPLSSISNEQKQVTLRELGILGGLSRSRMAIILYGSLLMWIFSLGPIQWFLWICRLISKEVEAKLGETGK